jgi:hypothetical protein
VAPFARFRLRFASSLSWPSRIAESYSRRARKEDVGQLLARYSRARANSLRMLRVI